MLGEPIEFGAGGSGDDENGSKLRWHTCRVGVQGRNRMPGDPNGLENWCS